ncbi:unnamed protein product [Rotaria magnacalcarata]|uniref:DRBM domain-containing protein n=1 Tax=Rotaria magnacalcarata TaxID=392030 RepID=A0A817AYJ3_9BILA|nr:unnamed protein product [Rotaria magnacalcarata]
MNNNENFNNSRTQAAFMFNRLIMCNQRFPLTEPSYINQTNPYYQSKNRLYNRRTLHQSKSWQSCRAEKRKQENFTCDTCGVEVNPMCTMDVHNREQKHMKKIKVNTDERTSQISSNVDSDKQPTVSSSSEGQPTRYNEVTSTYGLISETSPGHCKKFEVRLTVANETYTGMGTSIKQAQQSAAELTLATTTLKKPEKSRHKSKSSRTTRIEKVPSNDLQEDLPQQPVPVEINQQQINPIDENTFEILLNTKHD